MKTLVLAALLAGCASARESAVSDGAGLGQSDAPLGTVDAPAGHDAAETHDAYVADAKVFHDAPPIDADLHRDAPPDACVPMNAELLLSPTFDLTPVGVDWTQDPIDSHYPDITSDGEVQSAPDAVWLGGIPPDGSSLTDQVYQSITVPANTTKLVITGYYWVGTTEQSSTAVDTATLGLIQTNGTPIETALSLTNLTTQSAWTALSYTFTSNVAGDTVVLRMTSTLHGDGTGNDYSNFFFDTFALTATYCP
jgi:hypothetical protein